MRSTRLTATFLVMSAFVHPARVYAQSTVADHAPCAGLVRADEFYASGLYGQAYETYDALLRVAHLLQAPEYASIEREARYGRARAALMSDDLFGEKLMLEFIAQERPDPVHIQATMELANYYFNNGDYARAAEYYGTLRTLDLDEQTLSEARFKQGYSHFVRKDFKEAQKILGEVRELKTVYYYPVNYYYGMCLFFQGEYSGAQESFERVAHSDKYKDYVPYYITQMHFARGEYDQVVAYARPRLDDSSVKNKSEMQLLVGRAYFELGHYAGALPHLQAYADTDLPMRAADFYQLAFVQYQSGDPESSILNFRQVASENDLLGQRANFYLADCYLRTGDIQSARTAFRNCSRMTFDETLREEALLQFGKVSAQLYYDSEAIQALDEIPAGSQYYSEAQEVLRQIFTQTRDYEKAYKTLQSFSQLSPGLKAAYQEVCFNLGLQRLLDGNITDAEYALQEVEKYPIDQHISARALFWRAEIAHREKAYAHSAELLRQYFTLVRSVESMPAESSPALAHYMQGYNAMQLLNYVQAQSEFTEAITMLRKSEVQVRTTLDKPVLSDAMVRAGDCAFKRSLYPDARKWYQDAVSVGGTDVVYAKYQIAMIAGLTHNQDEKIRILEELGNVYPESQFADDALFQLGITYQETGSDDKAIHALRRLLDKYPASDLYVPALIRLGLIAYNTGKTQDALNYYKRVFSHSPTPDQGREALSAIEEIYVRDLGTPDAYFSFVSTVPGYTLTSAKKDSVSYRAAEIQYEQGAYDSAVKAFTDYLEQFPHGIHRLPAMFYRGDAFALLNAYDKALPDFDAVVQNGYSPYYVDALKKAALISYHHAMDFKSSLTLYQKLHDAVTDPGTRLEAELGALRSAYRSGMADEVIQWQERINANSVADAQARGEAAFYTGKVAMEIGDNARALNAFFRVTELLQNVQAAEARFRIAQIHFFNGDLDSAEELCHSANEQNAAYPYWVAKSLILMSDIFLARNDLFNAKAPLEAVIESFEGDTTIRSEAQSKLDAILRMEAEKSQIHRDTSRTLELIDDHQNEH